MTNEEFIHLHIKDDVRSLALKPVPKGVDAKWCLQQIEGWQLATVKLPTFSRIEGLWYPPRLSMEQCSSEAAALYKRSVAEMLLPHSSQRKAMADLTGGFGVDFWALAPLFQHAVYKEEQPVLCNIASHNFPLLQLDGAVVSQPASAFEYLQLPDDCSLVYLDPARRNNAGRKTVAIEDCSPDVGELMPTLQADAEYVMLKLSPMLDITRALRTLPNVCEVHVVSVKGECKELLVVCSRRNAGLSYFCTNLDSTDADICVDATDLANTVAPIGSLTGTQYLFEPNASVLKAGAQDVVAHNYGLQKLHPMSNLYVGTQSHTNYPGRCFRILTHSDFGKQNLKTLLNDTPKANLTVRNFPVTVAELRKRLKLKEGGSVYLFATTVADGSHVIIKCEKA